MFDGLITNNCHPDQVQCLAKPSIVRVKGPAVLPAVPAPQANSRSLDCEDRSLRGRSSSLGMTEFFYWPSRNSYCLSLSGTTLSLPCRTKGESAKSLLDLIAASVIGLGSGFPALIFTRGFLGSETSLETTVAVPIALLSSPVW